MVQKSYLLPFGNNYKLYDAVFIEQLKIDEMVLLAQQISNRQNHQLMADALSNKDRYYHGRKVVDALQQSLEKLEESVPMLHDCIKNLISVRSNLNN